MTVKYSLPRVTAIFPEYLSDPNILVCPSDTNSTQAIPEGENCVAYTNDTAYAEGPLEDDNTEALFGLNVGCMEDADDSYFYFGWVPDKIGDEWIRQEPLNDNFPDQGIAWFLWVIDFTEGYTDRNDDDKTRGPGIRGRLVGPAASDSFEIVLRGPNNILREAARVRPVDGAWEATGLAPGRYHIQVDAGADRVLTVDPPLLVIEIPGDGIVAAPDFRVLR